MLQGNGFYIWNIRNCENGDPQKIAQAAHEAGLTHLLIKVADRFYPHNTSPDGKTDFVPPLAEALRSKGIQVWGWQYVYGFEPAPEARMAIQRIQELNLDGFVIDAEKEYKLPGRDQAAKRYLGDLRNRFPDLSVALSSFRFPTLHPQMPWKIFLEHVNFNMPQVYWEKAHNPAAQLARTLREFRNIAPIRPIFPTGAAYKGGGWRPTPDDLKEFLKAVKESGLTGCNFWGWEFCRRDLPELWQVIAEENHTQPEPPPAPPKDIAEAYIDALNTHDPEKVLALIHPLIVHVTASRITQGTDSYKFWLTNFLQNDLPDARFISAGFSGTKQNRHLAWKAVSRKGTVNDGSDTFGLLNGKIIYHFSSYTLSTP
jgi:hypothetical protein